MKHRLGPPKVSGRKPAKHALKEQGMGKIISLEKMRLAIRKRREAEAELRSTEDDITAILNDYSLSPANRRWKLENMLMDVDEQLELYRKELEAAERKLNALVAGAEAEIARAYGEFETKVRSMTVAVRKLTGAGTAPSGMRSLSPHGVDFGTDGKS